MVTTYLDRDWGGFNSIGIVFNSIGTVSGDDWDSDQQYWNSIVMVFSIHCSMSYSVVASYHTVFLLHHFNGMCATHA